MERRICGLFTGTHLTIILTAAILAALPTALWSVDAFNNVAIQDPVSGKKAGVDVARRLFVYDQVGDWDETPANFVHVFNSASSINCPDFYTIPAGKALVITALHIFFHMSAGQESEVSFYAGKSCAGLIAIGVSTQNGSTMMLDVGKGIAVPAGRTISVRAVNNTGSAILYGYLVPAGWVPAVASSPTSSIQPGANPKGMVSLAK